MSIFELRYKLWLERNGKVFGKGPLMLLQGVKEHGSLSEAARSMDMSYNKAYNLIKDIESRLGSNLIKSKSGGEKGGGSELTEEAEKLIAAYQAFSRECEESIRQIFIKHFEQFEL